MKFKLFSIMAVVLFLAAGALPAMAAAPKLKVDATIFEAGDVPAGTTITHIFKVTNEGDADLTINAVEPGCGCSVADFDKVIKPGETGNVAIDIEIYESWLGTRQGKTALMETNDPNAQLTSLRINLNVVTHSPGEAIENKKPQPEGAQKKSK